MAALGAQHSAEALHRHVQGPQAQAGGGGGGVLLSSCIHTRDTKHKMALLDTELSGYT